MFWIAILTFIIILVRLEINSHFQDMQDSPFKTQISLTPVESVGFPKIVLDSTNLMDSDHVMRVLYNSISQEVVVQTEGEKMRAL